MPKLIISNQISFFLITALPFGLLIGSALINIILVASSLLFLITARKNFYYNNKNIIIILLIFWISLVTNAFFSNNFKVSVAEVFSTLRYFYFVLFIIFYFENTNDAKIKNFHLILRLLFYFITLDLIFEFLSGKNFFGNQATYPGRLSGVLGEELKIGNFYTGFAFIVLINLFQTMKNNKIVFLISLIFFIVSFLIGERANFIKFSIIIFILTIIYNKKNYKKNIVIIFAFLITIFSLINFSKDLKNKYLETFINPIIKSKNIKNLFEDTQHGAHIITAFNIFKDNYIFGSGVKTFRDECKNSKYEIKNSRFSDWRCSTHPHQYHIEFLSETGIFGYIFFLWFFLMSFIFFFKKNKKPGLSQTVGALYVFVNILPLIPSGSFFTTFSSTIFWFNYALMFSKKI
jgi:O-antigen ligase